MKNIDQIKKKIKNLKKKADQGDLKSIKECYNKDYGSKDFNKCKSDLSDNRTGCIQSLWKKYGCTSDGTHYPLPNFSYNGCNPNIKKCNIFDKKMENMQEICWEKCSTDEINTQLFKLSLAAENGNKDALIRCRGYNRYTDTIEHFNNYKKKNTILYCAIIVIFFLYFLHIYY